MGGCKVACISWGRYVSTTPYDSVGKISDVLASVSLWYCCIHMLSSSQAALFISEIITVNRFRYLPYHGMLMFAPPAHPRGFELGERTRNNDVGPPPPPPIHLQEGITGCL